ncbi:hypothetical protein [Aliidiomarina quisquiliarum]|uniref:hypothetical protein n=1 Tax=Aliidiomarina quisquiliarum TaxID=2938947 RepID=UPI00208F8589|nr:hypothetical protein [Aliidiomarina quisquiliarum]MCO4321713.1 hypothetical protein [Aliidiomarina quisquiliarum]
MKPYYALYLIILFISGCSSVPSVKLTKSNFDALETISIEANPNNNEMLTAITTVEVHWLGVFYYEANDGLGVRELALKFMDEHDISLNNLVQQQLIEKINADNLQVSIDSHSPNKLVITLNVVVLGMKHGFSDELTARFNIAGQLLDSSGAMIWSYNAIPVSPVAPGYSIKLKDLFESKESMLHFLNAAAEPIVQKLYENFKKNLV